MSKIPPINIYNIGFYYKDVFDEEKDYFTLITSEHKFQYLTESNKQDKSHRMGIYITDVKEEKEWL